MGIRYVGETVAKKLARAFTNIDKLMAASVEELMQVDEIGDRIAQSIVKHFRAKDLDVRHCDVESNVEVVNKLREFGIQFELSETITSLQTEKLKGLTIVISGTFEKHSRDEYKAMIEQNGGKNSGSISAKTSYVLAGDNMGPSKLEKAESLGIKIISEDDLLEMLE